MCFVLRRISQKLQDIPSLSPRFSSSRICLVWILGKRKPSSRRQELCLQIPVEFYMLDVVWTLGFTDGAEPGQRWREEVENGFKMMLLWR
jgi:hypothetical protein